MSVYRVWYSTYTDVEADSAGDALDVAAEIPMNDFMFDFAKAEEIEED